MRPHIRTGHRPAALAEAPRPGSPGPTKVTNPPHCTVPGVDPTQKPVASGSGVTVSINLTEPVLFLQGFDQAHANDNVPGNTAMLRGTLHLRVVKSTKIKAVTLKFKGRAVTKWPEGIPPRKIDFEETDNIMNHTWPFFNAQFPTAEGGTCADHVELFQATSMNSPSVGAVGSPNLSAEGFMTPKDAKRLSLQVNQSRSFNKNDANPTGPTVASKGYRTFHPGDYVYNFELPLDSKLPETIDVELGNVKYELEAVVERSGAFRTNLVGTKEVVLIRAPAEGSLETVEPIAISRNWEDQLHYDIVISGKAFPLGAQVPIAFKLTPLAKVQCHRIKVLVTENIEYFCSNKRVHRMEPTRKLQLFEKRSDSAPTSTFPGSTMRVTSGGGIPYDARARAAAGESVPSADPGNLLGDLRNDSATVGPTEMEFNVQLPDCSSMKDRERSQRLHFDTTYGNIQVHHWIKVSQPVKILVDQVLTTSQIVMRLSRQDAEDPNKRRHFEISIDSPFHILSCRATQANISLPAYMSADTRDESDQPECGCPNARRRRSSPASYLPVPSNVAATADQAPRSAEGVGVSPLLTRPPVAHLNHNDGPMRPIHFMRAPSFNPPAFEDEEPPPPLITPPPQYDSIASPTSGLADYFVRLSNTYVEDDDDNSDAEQRSASTSRVEIPMAGSSHVNRSMEMRRSWAPISASVQ